MLNLFTHEYIPPTGESTETLLLLHGTGGDERDLLTLGRQVAPGRGLLSPRGNVLENGMPRFFRRLAMGVFDLEDLEYRTHELASFLKAAAAEYHFDLSKLSALGYSNGANIAASLLLRHPDLLAGAVLLRPMVPFIPDHLPDLTDVGIFVAGGRRDPIVRPEQTEQLASLLRQAGADVDLQWSAGGHELSNRELTLAGEWLSRNKSVPARTLP